MATENNVSFTDRTERYTNEADLLTSEASINKLLNTSEPIPEEEYIYVASEVFNYLANPEAYTFCPENSIGTVVSYQDPSNDNLVITKKIINITENESSNGVEYNSPEFNEIPISNSLKIVKQPQNNYQFQFHSNTKKIPKGKPSSVLLDKSRKEYIQVVLDKYSEDICEIYMVVKLCNEDLTESENKLVKFGEEEMTTKPIVKQLTKTENGQFIYELENYAIVHTKMQEKEETYKQKVLDFKKWARLPENPGKIPIFKDDAECKLVLAFEVFKKVGENYILIEGPIYSDVINVKKQIKPLAKNLKRKQPSFNEHCVRKEKLHREGLSFSILNKYDNDEESDSESDVDSESELEIDSGVENSSDEEIKNNPIFLVLKDGTQLTTDGFTKPNTCDSSSDGEIQHFRDNVDSNINKVTAQMAAITFNTPFLLESYKTDSANISKYSIERLTKDL